MSCPSKCWRCFAVFLVCFSLWILSFALFSLFHDSSSSSLDSINITISLQKQGFAGPFQILRTPELTSISQIASEWKQFWPAMKRKLLAQGLIEPPERTCFIWLPECYALAKNDKILQYVTKFIGPNILLYGITTWKGSNENLQLFHVHQESVGCSKSINFVVVNTIDLISLSFPISESLLQALLNQLRAAEDHSLGIPDLQDRAAFFDRDFLRISSRFPRSLRLTLKRFDLKSGYGVFLDGNMIYRVGELFGDTPGLLMQFMAAECKVRDLRKNGWGSEGMEGAVYMPPTLLVAGHIVALNDVRLTTQSMSAFNSRYGMSGANAYEHILWNIDSSAFGETAEKQRLWNEDESYGVLGGDWEGQRVCNKHASRLENLTVFPGETPCGTWQDRGIWRYLELGHASTALVSSARIDHFLLKQMKPLLKFSRDLEEWEQIIIVLHEGMLYFRAANVSELFFFEVLELHAGSAVILSKSLLHASVPLELETSFLSFRWVDNNSDASPFIKATDGHTILLSSGEAYDPDNLDGCDVFIFVVYGGHLQILPTNDTLHAPDVLVIPAGQACVLWNIGSSPVKFFSVHLCNTANESIISFAERGIMF